MPIKQKEKKAKVVLTTEQAAKRKKIILGSVWGTILTAAIVTGITVPVVQAQKALPTPDPIYKDEDVLYEQTDANGNKIQVKYGDIKKLDSNVNERRHLASEMQKHLIKYLYEQEREASLWYEAIYNANKLPADQKHFALDSIEDVRKKAQKEFSDLEEKLKTQYGYSKKWEEKLNEEMAKSEWGKSKTKADAIEYRTVEKLKTNANRRYTFEYNKDFTYSEVKNGITANSDISYTYNGQKKNVTLKPNGEGGNFVKGSTLYLQDFFAKENENYTLPAADSSELKVNTKDEYKVNMFTTKSYISSLKNPLSTPAKKSGESIRRRFLEPWLKKGQLLTSTFQLAAKPNLKDENKPWTVTKDEITKLFKFGVYNDDATNGAENNVLSLGIERLSKFKGLNPILDDPSLKDETIRAAKNDELALRNISSSSSNAAKYGSNGFQSLENRLSGKDPADYLPLLSMVMKTDTPDGKSIFQEHTKDDLFKDLRTKIIKEVLFKQAPDASSQYHELYTYLTNSANDNGKIIAKSNYTTAESTKYAKFNNLLKKRIDELDKDEFEKAAGKVFASVFGESATSNKINSIIKVNGNYVQVTSSGIKLLSVYDKLTDQNHKIDNILKLIKRDLEIKSKTNSPDYTQPVLDIENMFKNIVTDDFKVKELLNDDDFIKYIKEQKYKDLNSVEKSFNDEAIESVKFYESILNEVARGKLLDDKTNKLAEYVKKSINDNIIADFKKNGNNKFYIEGHDDSKYWNDGMVEYLYKAIQDFINKN